MNEGHKLDTANPTNYRQTIYSKKITVYSSQTKPLLSGNWLVIMSYLQINQLRTVSNNFALTSCFYG